MASVVSLDSATPPASQRGLGWLVATLLTLGLAQRAAPLLLGGERVFRQFPTEDGYLMLTIARNLALGNGMATAAGTMPTNGTQPLATFLYALGFGAADGERLGGVWLAQLAGLLVAGLSAVLLYGLGRRLLHGGGARPIAALAAAAWFASPVVVRHSMNCLETGLYALLLILAARLVLARWGASWHRWSGPTLLQIGGLLGVLFWARNDACLFIFAVCLARLCLAPASQRGRGLLEAVVIGLTAVAVATPWLLHNWTAFGHIVPISGIAESFTAEFGQNLRWAPAAMAEFAFLPLQIPESLEESLAVQVGAALAVAVAAVLAARWARRAPSPARALWFVLGVFGGALVAFYGLYFGAFWFLSRYFFPLSPFVALVWAAAAHRGVALVARPLVVRVAFAVLLCGLVTASGVRTFRRGSNQGHFQVVEWVRTHVPETSWVAATQTGTLGFFHDRTINLDGKVNPAALRARQERGDVVDYIIDSPAQFLADWHGLSQWVDLLKGHFVTRVEDPVANLTVLERAP
ncbi:MAG: hypothetical protein AAF628_27500 [Planctomycetota bacterium]